MPRFALIAAFLVSAGVGWILVPALSFEPSSPAPLRAPASDEAPRSADDPALPSDALTVFRHSSLAEQLEQLRAAEEIPAATPVPARLWGRVLDSAGQPVSGRRIVATPILAPLDPELPYPSEAEFLRRRWREADWREKHRRVVTSAEDGSFDIDGLVGASYCLEAGLPDEEGEGIAVLTAIAEPVEPGWWVELEESPLDAKLVEVEIDIRPQQRFVRGSLFVLPAGEALRTHYRLQEDWIDRTGRGREFSTNRFKSLVHLPLTEGSVVFATLSADSSGRRSSETLESNRVTWDGESKRITLSLEAVPSIALRVDLPEGSERALRSVGLLALPTGHPFEAEEFARRAEWREHYSPQPNYTFIVDPGTYQVGVRLGGSLQGIGKSHPPRRAGPIDGFGVVTVGHGPVDLEVSPVVPERADGITVEVIGPDGKLLTNQRLRLSYKRVSGRARGTAYRFDRNADGTYMIYGFSEEVAEILRNPGLGWVKVHTHDRNLGRLEAEVTGGALPRAVLSYVEPATLLVDCGSLEADLWRRLRFSIHYNDERHARSLSRDPGAQGSLPEESTTIELKYVAPGEGRLIAMVGSVSLGEVAVSCASGESLLVPFPLSPVHRTEFRWVSPTHVLDLILEDGTRTFGRFSSIDETAERWLPPGRHKLVLRSGQTQQFSVPAAEPIWIEEQR